MADLLSPNQIIGNLDASPIGVMGSGLAAWYSSKRATSMWSDVGRTVQAGAFVAVWDDLSGNGRHLANSGGTDRPQLIGSGVFFDGVNDFLTKTFTLPQPAEIMGVWMIPSGKVANERFICAGAVNNLGMYFQVGTPTKISLFDTALLTTVDSLTFNVSTQFRALFNNTTSEIQINRGTNTSGSIAGTDVLGGISLGICNGTGIFGSFAAGEIVVANRAMTAGERTSIASWLTAQWPGT
jgi:hypothetical protein